MLFSKQKESSCRYVLMWDDVRHELWVRSFSVDEYKDYAQREGVSVVFDSRKKAVREAEKNLKHLSGWVFNDARTE